MSNYELYHIGRQGYTPWYLALKDGARMITGSRTYVVREINKDFKDGDTCLEFVSGKLVPVYDIESAELPQEV